MRFEVSKTDYQILVSVLKLFRKGGYSRAITREDIIRESGLSSSVMARKIQNSYLKEKQLKENIL